MELYIIRHGQSTNNVTMKSDLLNREVDPPLTPLGQQQAAAAAHYLTTAPDRDRIIDRPGEDHQHGVKIERLLVSPMRRALQTAQPIAAALNLRAEVWTDIFEHGGMYLEDRATGVINGHGGLNRAGFLADFPDYTLPETVTDAGWWNPANGKETTAACFQRAFIVVDYLWTMVETHQSVALVTHGTFAGILLKALLSSTSLDNNVRLAHYNTAISRLDMHPEGLWLRYLNRIDHLSPDMISA